MNVQKTIQPGCLYFKVIQEDVFSTDLSVQENSTQDITVTFPFDSIFKKMLIFNKIFILSGSNQI